MSVAFARFDLIEINLIPIGDGNIGKQSDGQHDCIEINLIPIGDGNLSQSVCCFDATCH